MSVIIHCYIVNTIELHCLLEDLDFAQGDVLVHIGAHVQNFPYVKDCLYALLTALLCVSIHFTWKNKIGHKIPTSSLQLCRKMHSSF